VFLPIALWILACLLIGYFGRHKKLGFWGYFFGSIVLTPIIGLILLFASDPRKVEKNTEKTSAA
jgi:hypothetical protein